MNYEERWKRLPKSIREDMDLEERPAKDYGGHPQDVNREDEIKDEDETTEDDTTEPESKQKLSDIEPHRRPGRAASRQEDLVSRGLRKLEEEARLEARQKAYRSAMKKHNH